MFLPTTQAESQPQRYYIAPIPPVYPSVFSVRPRQKAAPGDRSGSPGAGVGLAYRVSALASATAISARVMIRPGSSSPPEPWTTPVCTMTDMAPRA